MRNDLTGVALGFFALVGATVYWSTHGTPGAPPDPSVAPGATAASAPSGAKPLELLFATSDGKKEWVEAVTKDWNAKGVRVGGRPVTVKLQHMRSGESRERILAGKEKPHLWSPVSKSWIELMDDSWRSRHGHEFLEGVRPTARTALVIGLWEPMARALGWPDRPIGWEELVKVALDPKGWASYGHPEWGKFKLGHSHPDFSTSANLSLLSLVYAETGKRQDLGADDLRNPKVVEALAALERTIVHYGESSSWLTEKMCRNGPGYLSAQTLYESSVVKANLKFPQKAFPLVAVYPKEGTFWENHPAGIVKAPWVGDLEREAGRLYLDFLTTPAQQARCSEGGFRPADPALRPTAPFDAAHGVDPDASDASALAPVSEDVFRRANALWHEVKKKSTVYLVVDTSGSMNGEPIAAARRAAAKFLSRMEPDDEVEVIAFATHVCPIAPLGKVKDVGEQLQKKVSGLFADGNTALYDAVGTALREIARNRATRAEPRLYGVVVMTDGKDTSSATKQLDLLAQLPKREDTEGVRVFTIGFGTEADEDLLREIADRTNALYARGDESTLEKIYLQISSYF